MQGGLWVAAAPRVWLRLVGHLSLATRHSIVKQLRQLLLAGQLRLNGSSESAAQGIITRNSVLSKNGHLS